MVIFGLGVKGNLPFIAYIATEWRSYHHHHSSFYLYQATWPIHKHTKTYRVLQTDRQTDRISKKYNEAQ